MDRRPGWKISKGLYGVSPLLGALATFLLFATFAIWGSFDFGEAGYFLLVALSFVLLIALALSRRGRQRTTLFATAGAVLLTSLAIFKAGYDFRAWVRWTLGSWGTKADVQAQTPSDNGQLRHTLWDGWGFAGAGDTDVFLVFDPKDALALAAKTKASGAFTGLPCEVYRVRRLEPHWYAVTFYTNTSWDSCS